MRLEVKDLCAAYDRNDVLSSVDFTVEEGEFFTILGDSASGKSTILKAIAGLLPLKGGDILLDNVSIVEKPIHKREIAFVFQKPLLFPHLNVRRNICFQLENKKWTNEMMMERIEEMSRLLHIGDILERMPKEISGGQQQRVALARALAFHPKIILMDEPFSSLDPKLRLEFGQLIKSIQKALGLTVIFVTHDVNEALSLSDHVAFLEKGHLTQIAEPNTLFNQPINKVIARFLGRCNLIEGRIANHIFSGGGLRLDHVSDKEGRYLLMLRPHQINVEDQGPYKIHEITIVGKEKLLTLINETHDLRIEVESQWDSSFVIGQEVGITMNQDHCHFILD
jgi:ABC-type sugar transport system ATPase subunit